MLQKFNRARRRPRLGIQNVRTTTTARGYKLGTSGIIQKRDRLKFRPKPTRAATAEFENEQIGKGIIHEAAVYKEELVDANYPFRTRGNIKYCITRRVQF